MSKPSILAEPVLVGREKELEKLQEFLSSTISGKGKTVFVSGEAGSGKTRLIKEFLTLAKDQGLAVLTGWCLSNAAVPYFPFFEAFEHFFINEQTEDDGPFNTGDLQKSPMTEVRDLDLTSWLTRPTQTQKQGGSRLISAQVWKDQTFAAVSRTLESIARSETVILFIDDLQWADSASLSLLHYLSRSVSSEKIMLLATFRSEQLNVDTEGRPSSLLETLRLMRREELFEEIKLLPLTRESVTDLARNMLGGDLQPQLAQNLSSESQGNPLFVVESLRMLNERNDLIQDQDKWSLKQDKLGIPDKIKDIILQRLSGLNRSQRKVLDAASVIGERFDAQILASVIATEVSEVLETLDSIAKTTALIFSDGELFRFDHARSRDTIYEEIVTVLAKIYHSKVAEKLEETRTPGDLVSSDLAYHYAQAGNKEKALKFALAAGQDALARWSNVEAIRHFSYVIQTSGGCLSENDVFLAIEGLGDAYYANSMFDQSIRTFGELAEKTQNGLLKLRVLRKGIESAFQFGNPTRLMEFVNKAEPYAAMDRLEHGRILQAKSRALTLEGKTKAAHQYCVEALEIFEEEYSLPDIAFAAISTGLSYSIQGMPKEGLSYCLRSIALFRELDDFRNEMEAYWVAGISFARSLLYPDSIRMYDKAIEINKTMKLGDYNRLVQTNSWEAHSYENMGMFDEALQCSLRALEYSKQTDSLWAHEMLYANLIREYSRLGDTKLASTYFAEWEKLPSPMKGSPFGLKTRAIFYAANNQWDESAKYFRELFDYIDKGYEKVSDIIVDAKVSYSWALERQGCFDEAKRMRAEGAKLKEKRLRKVEHSDLHAHITVQRQVTAGEEFEMRFDLVNVGRKPLNLVRIENVLLESLEVVTLTDWVSLHNNNLEIEARVLGPFEIVTVKIILKASDVGGFYAIEPQVAYIDDLGEVKIEKTNRVDITVNPAKPKVLPGRVTSGFMKLDDLLLGGIPENYSVILTAASGDERELLITRFIQASTQAKQTTLYITSEMSYTKILAETSSKDFELFLCSPQPELVGGSQPNVHKIKGVDNLTEIDIALSKYFRTLDLSKKIARVACIQVISDVLLEHRVVIARKWIGSLLSNLKSRGFTILAVLDPTIHPPQEVKAIVGLFDGEILLSEQGSGKERRKTLRILKLYNQTYSDNELTLTKEDLLENR